MTGVRVNLGPLKERIKQICGSLCCGGKAATMADECKEETTLDRDTRGLNTEQIRHVGRGDSDQAASTIVIEPNEHNTLAIAHQRSASTSATEGVEVRSSKDEETRDNGSSVILKEDEPSRDNTFPATDSQNRSLVCTKCWQYFYGGPRVLQPFISDSSMDYPTSLDELEKASNSCSMCRFFLESIQIRQKTAADYLGIGGSSEQLLLTVSTSTRVKHPNPETAWLAIHCNELRVGTFVVFSDDPMTSSYIRRRDINFNVGSDATYQLAKAWLQECVEQHEGCPKYEQRPLPTRVLDVTPTDDSFRHQVRLCIPNGKAAPYTTLSYCWGGPQPFSTQKSTLESYMKGIDMRQLPATIRDAITVTRGLGLQYLWIDAFCIIQDDDLDKQKEIARMGEIYQHSYCTIIAECAARVLDGFLHERTEPPDCPQYKLPYVVPDGRIGTMLLRSQEAYGYDPLEEPLNVRGWTLQERLLPPRQLLYTSHRLRWKCQSQEYVDGGVTFNMYDEPYLYSMSRVLDVASGKLPAIDLANGVIDPWNPWGFWKRLIMEFSRRRCTDPADRVRAIGGIAKEFQRVWSPGSRYLAGHPECHLFESLAWYVNPFKMISTRRGGYRAPSWSWMASEGEITYDGELEDSRMAVKIIECNITLASSFAPFGDISRGELKLHGYLREARWLPSGQGTQNIYFTGDVEFLRDIHNHGGYSASAYPDSVEDAGREDVWCLAMNVSRTVVCGLVLDIVDAGERCFRRVGYFKVSRAWSYSLEPESSSMELDGGSDEHQVITIV